MNKLSTFEKRWLKLFASDISKSDIRKYVLDAGFIWHVFSWELKPSGSFLAGEAARQAFDSADKSNATYYEPFPLNGPHETQYNSPSASQLDDLEEVYIISSDNSWTYIKTHERNLGPYFYRADIQNRDADPEYRKMKPTVFSCEETGKIVETDERRPTCPICGKTVFKEVCDCDICMHCGWENDDLLDYDSPSHLDLADYKKRYEKYLLLYPDYTWEKYGNPEITNEDECRLAHRYCAANEAYVHESDKCGCFFCLKTFGARDVVNWLDDSDGKTAVCPYCGVDSVLPDSKADISEEFLEKMYKEWFGRTTKL
ncbi:MAG: DUF4275 family protein [Clostridia bacterium]|nr:DUF4275 family protein [Clostridia bacterium]